MSQLGWIALLAVAACGRFQFDATDAAPGRIPGDRRDAGDITGDAGPAFTTALTLLASNADPGDRFGATVAISRDGSTIAVGAPLESSNSITAPLDNSNLEAGAVYIFTRSGTTWAEQAYLKANVFPEAGDQFGWSVALSGTGDTLVVGVRHEDSAGANPADNSAQSAGAAYVLNRVGTSWTGTQAYLKSSTIDAFDAFGERVAISDDGTTIAIAAPYEDSGTNVINGNETDDASTDAGAVYVFTGSGANWTKEAYIKSSNMGLGDEFGYKLALSADGNRLAVGAYREDSSDTGVNATGANEATSNSGAVYVFDRTGTTWAQTRMIKPSNTAAGANFGYAVALAPDGSRLYVASEGESASQGAAYVYTTQPWAEESLVHATNGEAGDELGYCIAAAANDLFVVGSVYEDSSASNFDGNANDESLTDSGAAYLFERTTGWTQRSYVKASTPRLNAQLGWGCALSGDGRVLAVSAPEDNSMTGAVYVWY